MSLAQTTAQNPISLGVVASNGGVLSENFDIGLSYANFAIYGTIKEAGNATARNLRFSDLGKITLSADGADVMDFNSGYELQQYLMINGFNNGHENTSSVTDFIMLPQYRNVNSNIQQQITYLDTGINQGQIRVLNLRVEVLKVNADDNKALTDANIYYQGFTSALTGTSARLSVKTYQFTVNATGQIDFADIPRVGVVGQIALLPPSNVGTVAEAVAFDDFKIVLSNVEITTLVSLTNDRQINNAPTRYRPRWKYTGIPIGHNSYSIFDMTRDGFGTDPAGNLAALGLTEANGTTSFRLRIEVSNKGTDSDPKLIVMTQNIVG